MRRGQAQPIGVQVEVAGGVGKRELEELVDLVGLPEEEVTSGRPSGRGDEEPGG